MHRTLLFVFLGLVGCGSRDDDARSVTEGDLTARHTDIFSVLSARDLEKWIPARRALARGLAEHCATADCAGLKDVASVELECAATASRKQVRSCLWVVGGSTEVVDAATGEARGEARVLSCNAALSSSAHAFVTALAEAGKEALDAPVLGGGSFRSAVDACFAAAPRPAPPPATTGDFASVEAVLTGPEKARWAAMKAKLPDAFDDVCGDTFCEGEYEDISALGLSCATNRKTGEVTTCTWSFALASTRVAEDGTVGADSSTARCTIPVGAPAADLVTALDVDDPLHAALPGKTTTLFDALVDCL